MKRNRLHVRKAQLAKKGINSSSETLAVSGEEFERRDMRRER